MVGGVVERLLSWGCVGFRWYGMGGKGGVYMELYGNAICLLRLLVGGLFELRF